MHTDTGVTASGANQISLMAMYFEFESTDGDNASYSGEAIVQAAALMAPSDKAMSDWIRAAGENLLGNIGFGTAENDYEVEGYFTATTLLGPNSTGGLVVFRPHGTPKVDIEPFRVLFDEHLDEQLTIAATATTSATTASPTSAPTTQKVTATITRSGVLAVGELVDAGVYRTDRTTGFCLVRALTNYSGDYGQQWAFEEGSVGVVEVLASDLAFENDTDCGLWYRID